MFGFRKGRAAQVLPAVARAGETDDTQGGDVMRRSLAPLLVGLGVVATLTIGQAAASGSKHTKIAICHHTGSASHPFVRIVVSDRATLRGHLAHPGDIIPAPANGCPTQPPAQEPHVTTLSATLTGAAEVPGPGAFHGSGTAVVRLDQAHSTLCFALKVQNITLPAIAAHVHVGPAAVAGPVVVPLTPPDATGSSMGCVSVAPDLLGAIAGNPSGYYVNVHTTEFPSGAIRGQLG
jgi:hypothetical protein